MDWAHLSKLLILCVPVATTLFAQDESHRPVEGIMDNSFLIEEAYNQEDGVVQHILTSVYGVDRLSHPKRRALDFSFTQEWPAYGQAHQFSYTVPYSFVRENGRSANGIGDVLLNYRYQAYLDKKTLTGFAPRFSLVLPTGDAERGFGNDTVGYQWSLPFSTTLGDRWFVHANAGLTYLPDAGAKSAHDFLNYNLGASAIYCLSARFNLMLEWVGAWNQTAADTGRIQRQLASVISPGLRYAFNFRSGSQFVLGLAAPIGLTRAAPELSAFLYLSFEHRVFGENQ